jgi:hypothetical protein
MPQKNSKKGGRGGGIKDEGEDGGDGHLRRVLEGAVAEQADVLDNSEQSIYIFMDDAHKACNDNFAKLLGYRSPVEWAGVKENFPDAFVAKKSQRTLVSAYRMAMERFVGSSISVTWKKDGDEVSTTTMLVPIEFEGHLLALHLISEA